ncbi:MAG: teichuronic acid biosynthesis glycosyl transferase tuaG [Legionellales bacterium]|nr:teichuronic acid biosynthesis glycosyl transferase tuaG [Legionellales bacterium]
MPAVSVIVPVYNAQATLHDTLESISNQTFADLEVFLLNDGSSDSSGEIIDEYVKHDSRFQAVHLEKNYGAPAAPRNIGIDLAQGEWIAFIDSDDIWHSEKIERQLDVMKKTDTFFSSTSMFNFTDAEGLLFPDNNFEGTTIITFDMQLRQFLTPTSSVVVAKEVISKFRFNESLKYKAREDVDCFLHCHELLEKSIKINGAMLAYRIRDGQISGSKIKMIKRHYYVLKNYKRLDNSGLGYKALWYTINHFVRAFFPRIFLKRL